MNIGPSVVARFPRLRISGLRRVGWGIGDQALSSLTNFVVTLMVARALGAEQFGAFTLAFVTYSLALNTSKGLTSDPLMVRFSLADVQTWRKAAAQSTGTALLVGLVLGVCMLLVAIPLHGTVRSAFLALGLIMPGLLLQDSWRYAFFTNGRGELAFLNDLVWVVALVPALAIVLATGRRSAFWFILAWGIAALIAAVVGLFQARVVPRPAQARNWIRQHRDLGFRYLVEGTSSSIATQLRAYGGAIIIGLAGVGYMQAATSLMGPIMIIFFGSGTMMVPELARVIRSRPHLLARICALFGLAISLVGLTWGVLIYFALNHGLGDLLLGQIWRGTYPLIPLSTAFVVGLSLQLGASAGLRALGAARRSVRAMLLTQFLQLSFALIGAAIGGVDGLLQGSAIAAFIGAYGWWRQLQAAMTEAGIEHQPVVRGTIRWITARLGRHASGPQPGDRVADTIEPAGLENHS